MSKPPTSDDHDGRPRSAHVGETDPLVAALAQERYGTPNAMRMKANSLVALNMWVIYDHPRDYPDGFIARRWEIGKGTMKATTDTRTAPTIKTLRLQFEALGLHRLNRDPTDDPVILETWL